jgi:hypothetical protein
MFGSLVRSGASAEDRGYAYVLARHMYGDG